MPTNVFQHDRIQPVPHLQYIRLRPPVRAYQHDKRHVKTRMHSSRMRTACSLPYGVGAPRQRPPGQRPPVDRQTPVKTLPSQTSFAGGKNIFTAL